MTYITVPITTWLHGHCSIKAKHLLDLIGSQFRFCQGKYLVRVSKTNIWLGLEILYFGTSITNKPMLPSQLTLCA